MTTPDTPAAAALAFQAEIASARARRDCDRPRHAPPFPARPAGPAAGAPVRAGHPPQAGQATAGDPPSDPGSAPDAG